MSVNQVNNFIEGNLPTLVKVMEGDTWQKVAFVFLSVLTGGILPLAIAAYDLTSSLISGFTAERNYQHIDPNFGRIMVAEAKSNIQAMKDFLDKYKSTLIVSAIALTLLSGSLGKIESLISVRDALISAKESLTLTSNLFFEKASNLIKDNPKIFVGTLVASLATCVGFNRSHRNINEEGFEELVDPPSSPTREDFLRTQYAPAVSKYTPSAPAYDSGNMYPTLPRVNSHLEGQ